MKRNGKIMSGKSVLLMIISWVFGVIVFAAGALNTFWGNDPGFGILMLLSCVYFPPVNVMLKQTTGVSIPTIIKIFLAIFIIWAALGVGQLLDKIHLMMMDL